MDPDLKDLVFGYIKRQELINSGESICCALSGGKDSVCLLFILLSLREKLGIKLSCVHVHHGIREESDGELAFVRELCEKQGLPLYFEKIDAPGYAEKNKLGLEEAARILRYEVFERAQNALHADKIALAHHASDQAETVLENLLRGSSLKGLCGMQAKRASFIRPLLSTQRAQIDEYIEQNKLPYVQDASNFSTEYTRNRIRLELIPELKSYNPLFERKLVEMSEILSGEEAFLEAEAQKSFAVCVDERGLDCEAFAALHPAIRKRVALKFIAMLAGRKKDIGKKHVDALEALALGRDGHRISLPYGVEVEKTAQSLKRAENVETSPDIPEILIEEVSASELPSIEEMKQKAPGEVWAQLVPDGQESRAEELKIRCFEEGDYLIASGGKKLLSDYFTDIKLARMKRAETVVVARGKKVLWIAGLRLSDDAKVKENVLTEENGRSVLLHMKLK